MFVLVTQIFVSWERPTKMILWTPAEYSVIFSKTPCRVKNTVVHQFITMSRIFLIQKRRLIHGVVWRNQTGLKIYHTTVAPYRWHGIEQSLCRTVPEFLMQTYSHWISVKSNSVKNHLRTEVNCAEQTVPRNWCVYSCVQ